MFLCSHLNMEFFYQIVWLSFRKSEETGQEPVSLMNITVLFQLFKHFFLLSALKRLKQQPLTCKRFKTLQIGISLLGKNSVGTSTATVSTDHLRLKGLPAGSNPVFPKPTSPTSNRSIGRFDSISFWFLQWWIDHLFQYMENLVKNSWFSSYLKNKQSSSLRDWLRI